MSEFWLNNLYHQMVSINKMLGAVLHNMILRKGFKAPFWLMKGLITRISDLK